MEIYAQTNWFRKLWVAHTNGLECLMKRIIFCCFSYLHFCTNWICFDRSTINSIRYKVIEMIRKTKIAMMINRSTCTPHIFVYVYNNTEQKNEKYAWKWYEKTRRQAHLWRKMREILCVVFFWVGCNIKWKLLVFFCCFISIFGIHIRWTERLYSIKHFFWCLLCFTQQNIWRSASRSQSENSFFLFRKYYTSSFITYIN